jgi:hypothetical protein
MKAHRQDDIFHAMGKPAFYPHPVEAVEVEETHISKVFLTGAFVYKIKKPVNLEFLDFSTLDKRRFYCQREVTLNRRLTEGVYLDVVPITVENGRYTLDGPGEAVEYAVKMRQLPAEHSVLYLLEKEQLPPKALEAVASVLAEFYQKAETGENVNRFGSLETIGENWEENFRQLEDFLDSIVDGRKFDIIRSAIRSFLKRQGKSFNQRITEGKIRDCHGDLKTEHVYLSDGIQIIDCIEFNERFRYSDITADLAFLAMDLDYHGQEEAAREILHTYVLHSKDCEVYLLLDFYACYRAVVRAKVNCLRVKGDHLTGQERAQLKQTTDRYMDLAYKYAIKFARPTLRVVCGMPASGKSTIARELAKTMQLQVFRSDRVRKALFEVPPEEHADLAFEEGIYSQEATALTYGKLLLSAQEALERGCSVLLDATYSRRHHREEVLRLAGDMDVHLIFLECICRESKLKERLLERDSISSVSDARRKHFEQLRERYEAMSELDEKIHCQINTEQPIEESVAEALASDHALLSKQAFRQKTAITED